MLRNPVRTLLSLLIVAASAAAAQSEPDAPLSSMAAIPQIRYSSLSGFGGGARVLMLLAPEGARSAATLAGRFVVTEEEEVISRLDASVESRGRDGLRFEMTFEYRDIPERFYGIGAKSSSDDEEVYTPIKTRFHVTVFRELIRNLDIGIRYEYENVDMEDLEPGGELATGRIRGSEGMKTIGTGLIAEWDRRDRRYNPTRGSYHQFYALAFDRTLGGDDDFLNGIVDLRWYRAVDSRSLLAAQFFSFAVTDDAPVQRLAALGGRPHTRGYSRARYVDQVMLAGQVEFRRHLFGRWGIVLFGGAAQVASDYRNFSSTATRPTFGAGARLRVTKRGLNVRGDAALGFEGPRFDLTFDEAF